MVTYFRASRADLQAAASPSQTSRYRATPVYVRREAGKPDSFEYGLWRAPSLIKEAPYREFVVKSNHVGRLDQVSYDAYGTPALWWVIATANDLIDVYSIKPGQVLRIPRLASTDQLLTTRGV